MDVADYYSPETAISTLGYKLGRSARAVRIVTVEAISPLKAGAAVGAAWGGVAAVANTRKYKQGKMTKRDAVLDTAGESAGMGLAAGLGLLASNTARASALVVSASVVPLMVGVVVTAGTKALWDYSTKRCLACQDVRLAQKEKNMTPDITS